MDGADWWHVQAREFATNPQLRAGDCDGDMVKLTCTLHKQAKTGRVHLNVRCGSEELDELALTFSSPSRSAHDPHFLVSLARG